MRRRTSDILDGLSPNCDVEVSQVGFTESKEIREKKAKTSARSVLIKSLLCSRILRINYAMMTASIDRPVGAALHVFVLTVRQSCSGAVPRIEQVTILEAHHGVKSATPKQRKMFTKGCQIAA
jgi:hypothetical protein